MGKSPTLDERALAALRDGADEVHETHISRVYLRGDRALKLKKPVDFGFLDFSTAAARRAACEAEVRLNARLAPAVYLGVVAVGVDDGGRAVVGVPEDRAVDWAVEMVRLDDGSRADRRLEDGDLGVADVVRIAERLADFHAEAARGPEIAAHGRPEAVAVNVRENFDQTRGAIERFVSAAEAREIEAWQLAFLERERARFLARVAGDRVRDGHGDLRLEHVYLDTRVPGESDVTVIDCIEFNERFRHGDVCADLAFLSMDLLWHGRGDLAERLLAAYARAADDYDLYGLVDFYESYRAFVRGKVASFVVAGDPPATVAARASEEARRYFLLSLASERRRVAPPMVVVVGGLVAAGKSTIADRLAIELEAPVVDTDRTRKSLLGLRATESAADREDAYAPETSDRSYREVLRRAGVVLDSGRPVVLDGTFRTRARRAEARRLARERGLPFLFVECRVDEATARARLRARGAAGGTVSDAREDVYELLARSWEPVDDLPEREHTILRTDGTLEASLEAVAARLPRPPPR